MHTRTRTTTNFSSGTPAKGHGVRVHGSIGKPPEASTGTVLRHEGDHATKRTTTHGSFGKSPTDSTPPDYCHDEGGPASLTTLPQAPLCVAARRNLLLAILESFSEDAADLVSYLRHVGFDVGALRNPRDLSAAWLGHYRRAQADYDVDRACCDLATWPPIAARIRELQHHRALSPEISGV